ncbi:PROTEIN TARGETING TO STARCH (PTST) [Tasmannia lanceolata]|uniref:PROTEIN TARGETING TO STARCH (PTST) n=1 Tax=Tasmannia lanceolata TaxID=3420 RepID=UPI0040630B21
MESRISGAARCCLDKSRPSISWHSRKKEWENSHKYSSNVPFSNLRMLHQRLAFVHHTFTTVIQIYQLAGVKYPSHKVVSRRPSWRTFSMSVSLENEPSLASKGDDLGSSGELVPDDSSKELLSQQLDADQLKSLLSDSERKRLIKKLSEANQHNRFLKRQLQITEDALVNYKSELAVFEEELQILIGLAQEIAKSDIQLGSRKIYGKYIPSYLLSRLEAFQGKLKEQIKDVDSVNVKEVDLFWFGMAEIVQVMGSFDGWSQGEQLAPEYTGDFNKFATTLKLRPGRYEIKFMVDGEWQLSPELPTTGEGLMQNNLLIVK